MQQIQQHNTGMLNASHASIMCDAILGDVLRELPSVTDCRIPHTGLSPVFMMLPKRDTYDIVLISVILGISQELSDRNSSNVYRKTSFGKLVSKAQQVEKSYKGALCENLGDKVSRFLTLFHSDISAFMRLWKAEKQSGGLSAKDTYEVALLNSVEAFIKSLIEHNSSFSRLEWFQELLVMVQQISETLYPGYLPEEMVNKADWFDRMISADLTAMMKLIKQ